MVITGTSYINSCIGFRQVIDRREGIISYQDKKGSILTINKSNNMSSKYLERILNRIGVTYNDFVRGYKAYVSQ